MNPTTYERAQSFPESDPIALTSQRLQSQNSLTKSEVPSDPTEARPQQEMIVPKTNVVKLKLKEVDKELMDLPGTNVTNL